MCAKKIVQWRWNYYIVKGMLPKESEFLGSCCNNILSLSSMMNDVIIKTKLGRSSTCTFTMQWQCFFTTTYTLIFHDLKKTPILILNNNELMSLEFNSWWFTENTFFFAYYSYTMRNTKLYICRTCIPCIANSMIFLRATRIAQNHIQYIHTTTCQT